MLKKIILTILVASFALAGCSGTRAEAGPLTKVRLPMGYIPNVQYAPFYVAVDKGYFANEGIEIEFDYSSETDGVALVGAGEIPFTLASGEQVLLARAQGLPVVYSYAWYAQFPISVISKPELAIKQPADLRGKKIGLPGLYGANYIGLEALLFAGGLSASDVTMDSIGYNQVEAYASGQQDAVVVYTTNEPIVLRSQNFQFNELKVADYLQLVGNGLVTNEKTIAENPELVRAMGRALSRGLLDTGRDPDAAYEICKKFVPNLGANDEVVQKQVLAASIRVWNLSYPGKSDPKAWANMNDLLVRMGLLSQPVEIEKAFTNDFIP